MAFGYFAGMKQIFALVILLLAAGLTPAFAQADADDQYLMIYSELQQADSLSDSGQPQRALAQYAEVQTELRKFQKVFPDWNPNIVSFRLKYLAGKIADITAALPAPVPVAANAPVRTAAPANAGQGTAPVQSDAEVTDLRNQLQQLQADNTTLAAKLKEALSVQPAAIDSRELDRARQQVESLTKENDLLKASLSQGRTRTNVVTLTADSAAMKELQAALVEANQKLAVQTERADKLALENLALQSRVQTLMASPDALEALRAENDVLKKQIAELKVAAAKAPDIARIQDDEKQAQLQLIAFQSQSQIWKLEKAALENKLKKSQSAASTTVAPVPVPVAVVAPSVAPSPDQTKNEARIQDLTRERDDLLAQLGEANKKLIAQPKKSESPQVAALAAEVETLRGRLAVDEATAVPYTTEELALFNAPAPAVAPAAAQKASNQMPAGSAALVVQAQSYFSQRQFGRAETNYLHVLEQDSNNVIVLGNLAAIEVEEGKLDDAEKHLQAALALNPDDAYNLSRLGYLKFQQEKYDEALDSLGRAAKLDPQNPEIENYLGVALSHKGLRVQAETALRKAIQIDPNYAAAQNNLAVIYLSQKPPLLQLARWHYQKAVDAGQPRNPDLEKALAGETPAPNSQ